MRICLIMLFGTHLKIVLSTYLSDMMNYCEPTMGIICSFLPWKKGWDTTGLLK